MDGGKSIIFRRRAGRGRVADAHGDGGGPGNGCAGRRAAGVDAQVEVE